MRAMVRLRTLLAWFLLAALPLQGFAAATMLLCGPARMAAVATAKATHQGHGHEGHDHQGHQHAADHQAHAQHGDSDGPSADSSHGCAACAAACHAVGIASDPAPVPLALAPHVPLSEPFLRFDSRPPPVPDKPPRA
jgi:hypothetical protein